MVGDHEVHVARRRRSARGPGATGRRRRCRRPCGRRPSCTRARARRASCGCSGPGEVDLRASSGCSGSWSSRRIGISGSANAAQRRSGTSCLLRVAARPEAAAALADGVGLAVVLGDRAQQRQPVVRAALARRPGASRTIACCSAVSALNADLTSLTPAIQSACSAVEVLQSAHAARPSVSCSVDVGARAPRPSRAQLLRVVEQDADRARQLARPVGRDQPPVLAVARSARATAGRSEATPARRRPSTRGSSAARSPGRRCGEQSLSGASESSACSRQRASSSLGQREVPVHAVGDAELLGELAVRLGAALVHRRADHEVEVVGRAGAQARSAVSTPCQGCSAPKYRR